MTIVLGRDNSGREVLWQCSECGHPFRLGWESRCNACIAIERRHNETMNAIKALAPKDEREAVQ